MDFRILGPVEVRGERGVLPLGGPKPRAVLAVLLLHPNQAVSAERLAIALFGEDAPAGSPNKVQVLTVKPGFVDTKMTEGMKLPGALTAKPEAVARAVLRAHQKGRNEIYAKGVWRPVMAIIRTIPEPIFKRLKL